MEQFTLSQFIEEQKSNRYYYTIDESLAERAWYCVHMGNYKKNSATDEYRASVDKAYEIAEKQKRNTSDFYHEKIDSLLGRYAKKLADWYNSYNRNQASYPSSFIAGPANYNMRKHEKQMNREAALWEEYDGIKKILDKIESVGTGAVDLTDPNAREMLEERIDKLQKQLELDKRLNAYWRKHETFIGSPDLSEEGAVKLTETMKDAFERCSWKTKPFPDYELTSLRDKIKRTKARLEELNNLEKKKESDGDNSEKFDGGEIIRNYDENRLQIIFDEKPDEEMRTKLKSNGFRWSPKNSAWQRQLTRNAEYALERLQLA